MRRAGYDALGARERMQTAAKRTLAQPATFTVTLRRTEGGATNVSPAARRVRVLPRFVHAKQQFRVLSSYVGKCRKS